MVDETGRPGFLGFHPTAREDQLLGERGAEDPRQQLRASDAGKDAERRLRHSEDRRLARHDEVGQDGQLAAAGECPALDGRDDRHRAAQQPQRALLEDHVLRPPLLVGHPVALLQIPAGAERLVTGAGEDHGADVGVGRQRREAGEQIVPHRGVHGVVLLRTVERDGDDVAIVRALEEEVAILSHWTRPWDLRVRTSSRV